MSKTATLVAQVDPQQYGIEPKKANELFGNLPQIKDERKTLSKQYNDILKMDIELPETAKTARELRLKIRDNRTKGILVWHKTTKDFFLKGGQFVDAIKNKEIAVNESMEEKLSEIENYYENLEKERLKEVQKERVAIIAPYVEDAEKLMLSDMEDDVWDAYLTAKKSAYEKRIAEEKKAEEERLEQERKEKVLNERILEISKYGDHAPMRPNINTTEKEWKQLLDTAKSNKAEYDAEQEKQRQENLRLKAEAEKKEAELAKERAEALAKQKAIEEKAKKEREEFEAKAKKAREEAEAVKAKLEAELKAKREAEEKARKEEEARIAKEKADAEKRAKAPVKTKMKTWVNSFEVPAVDVDNEISKEIIAKFNAFKNWAQTKIEEL
jgi:hypothetical protein